MNDCRMLPRPSGDVKTFGAGQSGRGMEFAVQYAYFNFAMASGVNTPTAFAPSNENMIEASKKTGRDVGAMNLFMVIADDTDELAMAKWQKYREGADLEALSWKHDQGHKYNRADVSDTARQVTLPEGALNFNLGTLVGSYEKIAGMLDEVTIVPGMRGIILVFDDFLVALKQFGTWVQPLMKSRTKVVEGLQIRNLSIVKKQ